MFAMSGMPAEKRSISSNESEHQSDPQWQAGAITKLVDPPMAAFTLIAFSKASRVRI